MKILLLFISIASIILTSCNGNSDKQKANLENTDSLEVVEPKLVYGIDIDSYYIVHEDVQKNNNLSDILNEAGLGTSDIFKLVEVADSVFDMRKFRVGNAYALFYPENDSLQALQYFVYEINDIDFLVMDVRDKENYKVYTDKKEVKVFEKQGAGVIESSLWNAMAAKGIPTELSLELSEVYAWTIDFFGLQKGDSFKVVYTEEFVDSLSIGVKEIKYAVFNHLGENIYAIPYMQDSIVSFYDSSGVSLRKAFLKAPLRFSRISSHFSNARRHPVTRKVRPHHGVDYAAPLGTPVVAIGDGTVVKKGYSGGAGHMVKIKHNSTYTTAYLHLSKYGAGVNVGSRVSQGQVLGYVGSTGLSTGPHLDFRVYYNGSAINPLTLKSPPVEPVKESEMPIFKAKRDSLITVLNKL